MMIQDKYSSEMRELLAELAKAVRRHDLNPSPQSMLALRESADVAQALVDRIGAEEKADSERAVLWSFNFVGGGFNSVMAVSRNVAIAAAKAAYQRPNRVIDVNSFKAHRTPEEVAAYHKSLPLMD